LPYIIITQPKNKTLNDFIVRDSRKSRHKMVSNKAHGLW